MTAQHNFTTLAFCGIGIFKTVKLKEQAISLADKLSEYGSTQHCLGFDRSTWAELSCGQMPPQLYSFRQMSTDRAPQARAEVLIVLFKENNKSFDELHESFSQDFNGLLIPLQKCALNNNNNIKSFGAINEDVYEEEDFVGSYYLSCITWQKASPLPTPAPQARSFHIQTNDICWELCIAKDLNEHDMYMDVIFGTAEAKTPLTNRAIEAAYFFFPSQEILVELGERSRDKEKIHLNKEYTGLRC